MQHLIGGYAFKRRYIANISSELKNRRVLDIGCGTGYLASYMPQCEYIGVDLNETYIKAARKRSIAWAHFVCGDCVEVLRSGNLPLSDAAIAAGMFHHLSADKSSELLESIRSTMRPGGTMFCFEPVWTNQQSALARFIMRRDRGAFIQTSAEWQSLFEQSFSKVSIEAVDGLLRVPYTLALIKCTS